jgi:hypothetical protein
MLDLENQIARLEMRAEQIAIHLQDLGRNTPEASRVRSELYVMLQELAELKAERERRKALLELDGVA